MHAHSHKHTYTQTRSHTHAHNKGAIAATNAVGDGGGGGSSDGPSSDVWRAVVGRGAYRLCGDDEAEEAVRRLCGRVSGEVRDDDGLDEEEEAVVVLQG